MSSAGLCWALHLLQSASSAHHLRFEERETVTLHGLEPLTPVFSKTCTLERIKKHYEAGLRKLETREDSMRDKITKMDELSHDVNNLMSSIHSDLDPITSELHVLRGTFEEVFRCKLLSTACIQPTDGGIPRPPLANGRLLFHLSVCQAMAASAKEDEMLKKVLHDFVTEQTEPHEAVLDKKRQKGSDILRLKQLLKKKQQDIQEDFLRLLNAEVWGSRVTQS